MGQLGMGQFVKEYDFFNDIKESIVKQTVKTTPRKSSIEDQFKDEEDAILAAIQAEIDAGIGLETTVAPKKSVVTPTTQPKVQPQAGVEISSNAKGLAAALTNPTEMAKSKGNITQSYPIEFNGKSYKDVETAYQALKDKSEARTKPTKENSKNYKLMVDLIKAKLEQHPRLVSEITKQGGSAWILSSTHQPTKQNTVWETGGQNWFIESLADAYNTVTQSTVQKEKSKFDIRQTIDKKATDQAESKEVSWNEYSNQINELKKRIGKESVAEQEKLGNILSEKEFLSLSSKQKEVALFQIINC
jgi:hypothetical protein